MMHLTDKQSRLIIYPGHHDRKKETAWLSFKSVLNPLVLSNPL